MATSSTNKRRPPAIGPAPEHGPRMGARTSATGAMRPLDLALYPEDLFCSQNLYFGERTTIMVSRDPARMRGPQAHYHDVEDQFFITLRGELEIDLGAEGHTMRPGSLAHMPAGTPHRHRNDGDVDELHLEILVPGFSALKAPGIVAVDEDSEWEAGGRVVRPPDVDAWWIPAPGVKVFVYTDPSGARDPAVPESKTTSIFVSRVEPGAGNSRMHLHRFDQYYYVTEGTLGVDIGLDSHEVGPDTLVVIPAGVPHRNRAVGDSLESHLTLNVPAPAMPSTPDDPYDIRVSLEREARE